MESPHFQRVHYCELLVGDFLMRLRSKRFPPIEKDMKMILAHCGNLFLDPASLWEVSGGGGGCYLLGGGGSCYHHL